MSVILYALRHSAGALVYVGSTANWPQREKRWRKRLSLFCEDPSLPVEGLTTRFKKYAAGTVAADWRFEVLKVFEAGVSKDEVWAAELVAIEAAFDEVSSTCLNSLQRRYMDYDYRRVSPKCIRRPEGW